MIVPLVRPLKRLLTTPVIALQGFSYYSTDNQVGVINIQDEADFQKRVIANSAAPTIVDFHASWCKPCKILQSRLDVVMPEFAKSHLLARVDIDELQSVAEDYQIQVVPTLIAINKGKEVKRFEGLLEEEALRAFFKQATE